MNKLRKAERRQAKIRIGMTGISGSGKTYSALLMAYGLCGSWDKIAIIDTENGRADLYSHLGEYNVLRLTAPFTPERYIEAIKQCEAAKMEVIIIDSASHEWNGEGGCLEMADRMGPNNIKNWAVLTPRHNAFIEKIQQSPTHTIVCTRRKKDFQVSKDSDGKVRVEKAGMKEIQREGLEYEHMLYFEIDQDHYATCSKDNTELFDGIPPFKINSEHGQKIIEWNKSGAKAVPVKIDPGEIKDKASDALIDKLKKKCPTLKELNEKTGKNYTSWSYLTNKDATDALIKLMKK